MKEGDVESTAPLRFDQVRFETGPCPICGQSRQNISRLKGGRDDVCRKEGRFSLVECGGCGHIHLSPRPTPATMRYYYEGLYVGRNVEAVKKMTLDSAFSRFVSRYRLRTIEKVQPLSKCDRVLDIGASFGAFIEHVRRQRGIDAYALDFDPLAIEHFVNPIDVDVRCGELLDQSYPSEHFTVVTLFEILEHISDPIATLNEVYRILKPGGIVVLEVPCWDSLTRVLFRTCWFPLLLPQHLSHFTKKHLRDCTNRTDFVVRHHQSCSLPAEVTLSFWVGLNRVFGHKKPGDKRITRKLLELCIGLGLLNIFIWIDIPLVTLSSFLGRSGHQILIAEKPG